ncbi:MAG: membrane protein insertase YidC [Alphaproteobacteria bacterium]
MGDQKNLLLAIVISVAIILVSQFLLPGNKPKPQQGGQQTAGKTVPGAPTGRAPQVPGSTGAAGTSGGTTGGTAQPSVPGAGSTARAPSVPGAAPAVPAGESREKILARTKRVRIETPSLQGSISLTGAKLDDLTLVKYRTELAKTSPPVELLEPFGAKNAYFAEYGWVPGSGGAAAVKASDLPNDKTVWTADRGVLAPGQPVTLTYDNGGGLKFERIYKIDKNYLITVIQRVTNSRGNAVKLHPYAVVSRSGTPKTSGWYVLHEGPYGVYRKQKSDSGSLSEVSYEDVRDKKRIENNSIGGWLGFTDRYWMVAIVPSQDAPVKTGFLHRKEGALDKYQADAIHSQGFAVAGNGGTAQYTSYIFAGAKELKVIDAYAEKPGIIQFDLSIDFGWFYFLTKPIFLLLVMINHVVGNFGVAILLLTVVIKALFFPLANKSYKAMGRMKALTPKMQQIKERFGDNKELQNRELMELYKREKVNPMAGCWPILIQIPVFFSLYKVLLVNIEMRHAPFFWWIQDLSARDPTSVLNLFGLLPYQPPHTGIIGIISIGVWPLLMGISMWLQQRLNPAPPDPMQARIFMMLPIVFTFMLAPFAAGLVIYWTWNNLLSMAQQWTIMKRHGQLSQATAPAAGGPPKKKVAAATAKSAGGKAKASADGADGEAGGAEDVTDGDEDGAGDEGGDGDGTTLPSKPGPSGRTPPRNRGRSKRRSR